MERNNESWAGFKGELWKKEINVRDFIQNNYTPYTGDDSFLKPSSEKTRKVWNKLTERSRDFILVGCILKMIGIRLCLKIIT